MDRRNAVNDVDARRGGIAGKRRGAAIARGAGGARGTVAGGGSRGLVPSAIAEGRGLIHAYPVNTYTYHG